MVSSANTHILLGKKEKRTGIMLKVILLVMNKLLVIKSYVWR